MKAYISIRMIDTLFIILHILYERTVVAIRLAYAL
jgi:hypothetical protein